MKQIQFTMTWLSTALLTTAIGAGAEGMPTSLVCQANAKASRDYAIGEKRWEGETNSKVRDITSLFSIETRESKLGGGIPLYSLRDKVFSRLDTATPIVRSITRSTDSEDKAAEFQARVVSRFGDSVFLQWTNDANKIWTAAVDLVQRRAVVVQVFQGATSVGGEIETLDCK
jgi:hypothetical protein